MAKLPVLATWDPEDCPRLPGHDTVPAVRNRLLHGWTPFAADKERRADAKRDDQAKRRGGPDHRTRVLQ